MSDKQKAVIKAIDDANALELLATLALSLEAARADMRLCNEAGLLPTVNGTKAQFMSDSGYLAFMIDVAIADYETADKFDGAGVA